MKNNCCTSCGDQNNGASAQNQYSPVIEQDEPLVFDIQKRPGIVETKTTPTPIRRQTVEVEESQPKNEVVAYEKTTIIDDEPLKPREQVASGWLWAGFLLLGGGIVYKAL